MDWNIYRFEFWSLSYILKISAFFCSKFKNSTQYLRHYEKKSHTSQLRSHKTNCVGTLNQLWSVRNVRWNVNSSDHRGKIRFRLASSGSDAVFIRLGNPLIPSKRTCFPGTMARFLRKAENNIESLTGTVTEKKR